MNSLTEILISDFRVILAKESENLLGSGLSRLGGQIFKFAPPSKWKIYFELIP